MFFISNLCILCLNTNKNLITILNDDNEGIIIQKKLKYCLPEIIVSNLEIPEYICSNCMYQIDSFYKFKQLCLQNNTHLKSYLQTLTSIGETQKYLSVRLTDIKYQNVVQAESKDQILPNIGSEDELRIKEIEDSWPSEEAEASVDIEIKCADVSNNEELYPLLDEEKEIIVKEEGGTFEDNCENEFYTKFVKCEPTPIDSDVSLSYNEEASTSSNKHSIISTNVKEEIKIINNKKLQCGFCDEDFSDKDSLESHIKVHAGIEGSDDELRNEENEDNEVYPEFVKCESDVSLSDNEDIHEASTSSIKHSDNISANPEESNVTEKKKNRLRCAFCNKDFSHRNSLQYHLKVHAGIKDYNCSICDKKFINKSQLFNHEKMHSDEMNFECSICDKKFKIKSILIAHEKNHTDVTIYECIICKKQFKGKHKLTKHQAYHTGVKKHECSICNKKFLVKRDLLRHENTHKGIKEFECKICKKRFSCTKSLKKHEISYAGVDDLLHEKYADIKNLQCKFCKKTFTHITYLTKHEKGHENFQCTMCDKTFLQEKSLIEHENIHKGIKNYECEICKKGFSHKNSLRKHTWIHTDPQKYQCTICEKTFTRKNNYTEHQNIHAGTYYECTVCKKRFSSKYNFAKHQKTHTNENELVTA